MAQCVAHMTPNQSVIGPNAIKGLHCYLEQETFPALLSTGWL